MSLWPAMPSKLKTEVLHRDALGTGWTIHALTRLRESRCEDQNGLLAWVLGQKPKQLATRSSPLAKLP